MSRNFKFSAVLAVLVFSVTAQAVFQPIKIVASILPLQYCIERIGGQVVTVHSLVQSGQNPEMFEPTPRQAADFANAAIFFRIGMPFEQALLPKISAINAKLLVVDVRANLKFRKLDGENDPHIWTSPAMMKQIGLNVLNSLITIDPAHKNYFQHNYQQLFGDLTKLDSEIKKQLAIANKKTLLVYHPAWGYFADAYGLKQVGVEVEGKETGPQDLQRVIAIINANNIKVIFVEPQFSKNQADSFAKMVHLQVQEIDPLAFDYIANLRHVAKIISLQ